MPNDLAASAVPRNATDGWRSGTWVLLPVMGVIGAGVGTRPVERGFPVRTSQLTGLNREDRPALIGYAGFVPSTSDHPPSTP